MSRQVVAGALTLTTLAGAAPARAQPGWTDRGYVNVSGWFQPTTTVSDTVRPIDFAEAAVIDTSYTTRAGPGVDAGGGVRVWRNLGVGVDVSRFSKKTEGSVSAQVPHPFFFNRPRSVSGNASSLTRDETAVHLQAIWMAPLGRRWQLALGGGPSWLSVGQDLVGDVSITQTYPFDTATFAGATTAHRTGSRIGFNAGADVSYRVRPHVGLGFGVTFSRASVPLSDTVTVEAGGAHVGGGLRFRF
jgi:opacity protein-like surface antigen